MSEEKIRYKRVGEFPDECFVQEVIEDYFSERGFKRIGTQCVDFVCEHPDRDERWHVEARGASAAVGLDFRMGLGQLVRGITHRSTRYALALPDVPQFRNQIKSIEPWVCKVLNLHFILVDSSGSVSIIDP